MNPVLTTNNSAVNASLDFALPPGESFAVSPDAILAYCAASLNDLDSQLSEKMQAQENQNNLAKQWSDVETAMGAFAANGIATDCGGAPDNYKDAANALLNIYNTTTDSSLRSELSTLFNQVTGQDITAYAGTGPFPGPAKPPAAIDPSDFDQVVMQPIKNGESEVSQGSDLAMITIQSLVSQRQQAVQLSTQMMSAANETAMEPINNIGKE